MNLALVSPLPPVTPLADQVALLLEPLSRHHSLHLLVREPSQVTGSFLERFPVHPASDLPHLVRSGAIDLPIHFLADTVHHATQLPYVDQVPGVLVLHERQLDESFELMRRAGRASVSLADMIRASHAVLTPTAASAESAAAKYPETRIACLPPLVVPPDQSRLELRERSRLPLQGTRIGVLGVGEVNRELIATALHQLLDREPELTFLLEPDDTLLEEQLLATGVPAERLIRLPFSGSRRRWESFAVMDTALLAHTAVDGEQIDTALRLQAVGTPVVTLAEPSWEDATVCADSLRRADSNQPESLLQALAAALVIARLDAALVDSKELARGLEKHRPEQAVARLLPCLEGIEDETRVVIGAVEKNPTAEVVVLTYNGRRFIGPCLDSLQGQDYPGLKITVVDNASTDATADFVRESHPDVQLIEAGDNLGFAAGNNLAIRRSDAEFLLLLNQDAVARRDWASELIRTAGGDPQIGAVGGKMLMARCPSIINSTAIAINRAGWAWDRDIGHKDRDPSPLTEEVFGACAGAVLFRTEALQRLGAFDEKFFMYFEDVDLCWRLRSAGLKILYNPLAVVIHDWHGDGDADDQDRSLRRRYMCERNHLQTVLKNLQGSTLRRVLPLMIKHDRFRIRSLKGGIRLGDPQARGILKVIRKAWWWNLTHFASVMSRRRGVQRLRKLSDRELEPLMLDGITEPTHVGDLEMIRDRSSARPGARVVMGDSDRDALGPGWHGLEPAPDGKTMQRWCKAEGWFYLTPEAPLSRIRLRASCPPETKSVALWIEDELVDRIEVGGEQPAEVSFSLPEPAPAGRLLECRLETSAFTPFERGWSEDRRELGILVAEIGGA